jgi:hypothetical protein
MCMEWALQDVLIVTDTILMLKKRVSGPLRSRKIGHVGKRWASGLVVTCHTGRGAPTLPTYQVK